ncbi:MAG: DUF222 domain-containing protein, partial [Sporichthyaceae bacterium]
MDTDVLPAAMAAFAAVEAAVEDVVSAVRDGVWACSQAEVLDLARRHHVLLARLEWAGAGIVREIEARGAASAVGASSTQAWLSDALRISPQAAKGQVLLAQRLGRMPAVAGALAVGSVGAEQARAITRTVAALPPDATVEQVDEAQVWLVERAAVFHAGDLRRLGVRINAVIDP